jgi:hypothetical protein
MLVNSDAPEAVKEIPLEDSGYSFGRESLSLEARYHRRQSKIFKVRI